MEKGYLTIPEYINFTTLFDMLNERKTETIIRSHFEKYTDVIKIEEQKSDNERINKLLKNASKKGTGLGKPEFIITFRDHSELILVVECKANIRKHESKNRDNYADYAVDGALLYSSYLSKEFNVIALAVSGESKKNLKISHFLQLKKEASIPFLGFELLDIDSYVEGYLKSPEKTRQDYDSLLEYTSQLNEYLHRLKIEEKNRALLISCILIALDYTPFKKAYTEYTNSEDLANYLVETVINELKRANILPERLKNLEIQFNFIRVEPSLSIKPNILKELITEIDLNINSFVKTYQFFDILGQLYIEFLRYANSDAGLGIVLTPPHITEFFSDLAQVNKNSVIYDNCTGTAGFLIGAMKKMIEDAKGDKEKEKTIKQKQLYGVEYKPHIFSLAISNMYVHQDGKTNIILGDCFEETIIEEIKKKNPTVGLLNPPYKADKKKDTEELAFVLNNLECLVEGGICVSIVPMQCALAQKGKVYEYKNKLLELHTLEAVFSMPDELFFNSDVNVVTCVMLFRAHKPHPNDKETFFAYCKNDGFVKRKIQGRYDKFGRWKDINEKWVSYFMNRKAEAGFSINKIVTAKDEWCAEAYMETDYSLLSAKDFQRSIKEYVLFNELFLK